MKRHDRVVMLADYEARMQGAADEAATPSLATPEQMLTEKARQVCSLEGISYLELKPIQRLFLTHYRCHQCKLLPLYFLDMEHPKRARCISCGHLITFNSTGKYGKLRKRIAFLLRHEEPADVLR